MEEILLTSYSCVNAVKEEGIIVYCSTKIAVAYRRHVASVNFGTPQWQAATHHSMHSQYQRFEPFLSVLFFVFARATYT